MSTGLKSNVKYRGKRIKLNHFIRQITFQAGGPLSKHRDFLRASGHGVSLGRDLETVGTARPARSWSEAGGRRATTP